MKVLIKVISLLLFCYIVCSFGAGTFFIERWNTDTKALSIFISIIGGIYIILTEE